MFCRCQSSVRFLEKVADLIKRLSSLWALFFAALGIFAASEFARAGSEQTWQEDPASHCKFVVPASLTAGPTFWTGTCPGGKASGNGMLRRRDGNHAGAAFFGQMKDGVPQIGVVDLDGGYRVGTFDRNDIGSQADLEPQVRIDAFRAAIEAAKLVSSKYKAENKDASAQLYETLAKAFEAQLD